MFDAVTAQEVAMVAVRNITKCPRCGAAAFINIDCSMCQAAGRLLEGKGKPGEWIIMF